MTTPVPITPLQIIEDRQAIQYTGANSAAIAALIDDFTVVSENASGLTFTSLGTSWTVPVNGWITFWQGAVREAPYANDDDFRDVYRDVVAVDHVHDLKLTTGLGRPPQAGEGGA
jgi:hypothetical protein